MNLSTPRQRMLAFAFLIAISITLLSNSSPVSAQYAPARVRYPSVQTRNFVVTAPTKAFATRVAQEAERFRKELSQEWLGYEIKPWKEKCPILVKIEPHAGGVTRFGFYRGPGKSEPGDWEMEIFGPADRVLDSVLPHEVTHTIFATHFRRPLPRWADEGACTTVEHQSEKSKNHRMLMQFLKTRPSRGIPFNRMFSMRDYPRDILPLYAQGYSLARYLIQEKGKREFVRYVETGLKYEDQGMGLNGWGRATKQIYGHEDLSDLQIQWLTWVKNGSPDKTNIVGSGKPNVLNASSKTADASYSLIAQQNRQPSARVNPSSEIRSPARSDATSGLNNWYVRQMENGVAANDSSPPSTIDALTSATTASSYRPGSIAGAKPLKMVADSAFIKPNSKSGIDQRTQMQSGMNPPNTHFQPIQHGGNEYRSRPTIYR